MLLILPEQTTRLMLAAHPMQQILAEALTAEALTAEALTAEALIFRDILSQVIHGFQSRELYNRTTIGSPSCVDFFICLRFPPFRIRVNNDSSMIKEF